MASMGEAEHCGRGSAAGGDQLRDGPAVALDKDILASSTRSSGSFGSWVLGRMNADFHAGAFSLRYESDNQSHSAYLVPSSAVASDPLLMSYTPGSAVGLFGSGSAGTACQVPLLFVNGSSGTLRM